VGPIDEVVHSQTLPARSANAERAVRCGMRAYLIGTKGRRALAVGLVEVGVVGRETVAVRLEPVVGAACGALPLVLGAKARPRIRSVRSTHAA
jgi:hypothetical protein